MPARPRKPTMQDVARLAGVSTMTVSRVLTEPGVVAEETRERVQRAVEQLGYVPDKVAGSLSSRRTGFIAAILPTLTNANFADTAHGLTEVLRRAGYQLLIGYTMYGLAEEERLIRAMLARRPEALVLTGASHTKMASQLLHGAGIPIVEIWDVPPRPIDHAVGFSNREVGRMAARHLLALGHRRLGALGPRAEGDARDFRGEERLAGFAAVLQEQGRRACRRDRPGTGAAVLRAGRQVAGGSARGRTRRRGGLRRLRPPCRGCVDGMPPARHPRAEGFVADRLRRLRDRPAMRAGADDDPDRRP